MGVEREAPVADIDDDVVAAAIWMVASAGSLPGICSGRPS